MNAKQRCKLRRIERRKLEREQLASESRLEKRIEVILSGCSSRVTKAVTGTLTLRDKREESAGMCLPEVAMYNAGHRSKPKNPFHVYK